MFDKGYATVGTMNCVCTLTKAVRHAFIRPILRFAIYQRVRIERLRIKDLQRLRGIGRKQSHNFSSKTKYESCSPFSFGSGEGIGERGWGGVEEREQLIAALNR
jgi:hypothetical protein